MRLMTLRVLGPAAALVLLAGCITVPTGPSVMVLPGTGKSFDQFRGDEAVCRQYAYESIGGLTASSAQQDAAVKSAVVGTALGALAGAAFGGHQDAAVGAGVGLLTGSLMGASSGNVSAYDAQHRYNIAYTQCMYAKGHRVPVSRGYTAPSQYSAPPAYSVPPQPPPGTPPPPPPGTQPPPPN
jgi:hypothetical protein